LNIINLESLEERREFLCLEFAKKCLKSEKMKQFFQVNSKIHPMMTRNQEKYDIDFAKTGRLQDFPIIYIKRLLNGL
jgi:predicted alternative tryptophan synthase beta-subunit